MVRDKSTSSALKGIYKDLNSCFGPQHWWPAETVFEVIVGAILTQNTAWSNVEKAISQLKQQKLLKPKKLYVSNIQRVAALIRPCGYYNLKAARLRNFLAVLFSEFKGSLKSMFSLKVGPLRQRLLAIKGIGPETADSIILYAAQKRKFVVDAYTKRFLLRHRLIDETDDYLKVQSLFEDNLPKSIKLYNQYHALIVRLGKEFCHTQPLCRLCPLKKWK